MTHKLVSGRVLNRVYNAMVTESDSLDTLNQGILVADSQFYLNCTNLTQQQLENVNLVRGVTGMVCLVIVTLVFLVLLFNKAYKTLLQRLFLYHVITVLLVEAMFVLQFEHHFRYSEQSRVCRVVGFLSQYLICVGVTFINEVAMYLISVVYYSLKGVQHPLENSRCLKKTLEWIFIAIAIIFPLTYVWLPFLDDNYGVSDYICWIRTVDSDCEPTGNMELAVNLGFTYIGSVVVILLTIAMAIMYCRMAYHYNQYKLSQKMKTLLQKTLILSGVVAIGFFVPVLISLLFNAVSLIMTHEVYALMLIDAAGIPLGLPLIPGAFVVYFFTTKDTRTKPNYNSYCSCECCFRCPPHGIEATQEQPLVTQDCNTHPSSHPPVVPSHTYFNIEYTGGFTTVAENTTMLH